MPPKASGVEPLPPLYSGKSSQSIRVEPLISNAACMSRLPSGAAMAHELFSVEGLLVKIDRGSGVADEKVGRKGRNRTIVGIWHGYTIIQF